MNEPADQEFRRGVVAGFGIYVVWGLLTIYWKLLHGFRAVELVGWRIATSAAVMAAVVAARHRWAQISTILGDRRTVTWIAAAAVMLTVNWTAYVLAVTTDRVLETALGYFIAPLLTMALGVVVLRERLGTLQRIAVVLAVAAILVVSIAYGRVPWLALAIAVSWSTYSYLKRQAPMPPIDSMAVESFLLAIPAVVLVAVMQPGAASVTRTAGPGDVVLVLLTGAITVVPLMVFAYAAQRVPLTVLGMLNYLVPTINFLLGWLVYDEALTVSSIVGFALVWAALALITVDMTRRTRQPRPG